MMGAQPRDLPLDLSLDSPLDLDGALGRFGHACFRAGQREAIETLLEIGRLLLVAPTGGGKSLTYQLPASLLPGTTLVVSPLIALMHDQVESLHRCGIAATYLASTLEGEAMRGRMRGVARGEYDLVYVAPERLAAAGFRSLLRDLDCPLVAVDEAHCISEWGHDFRPEYGAIGALLEALPKARILACTATATPIVRDEILAKLGLPPDTPQRIHGFARPNLALRARSVGSARERTAAVDDALAEALGQPGAGRGTAILYSPTRRGAEEQAARLAKQGWRVAYYHAGCSPESREASQRDFIEGKLEIVVATNAFGMGIDRADVRAVVHLGPPGSLEAYYQEVGRAGRDGAPALGLMLHAAGDFPLRRRLLERGGDTAPPGAEIVEHKWNLFLELMRWADGGSCRHDAVLRYFGDEEETISGCGVCDVCVRQREGSQGAQDPEYVTLVVRKALSGVARVQGRFGLGAVVALLRGDGDKRLERAGLDRVSTHGVLAEYPAAWLQRLLLRLVTAGWVGFAGGDRPVVTLTAAGFGVMRGELPARVELPSRGAGRTRGPASRPGPETGKRRTVVAELDAAGRALFDALRAWRLETSRREGVPPYVVASDRTLRDVALLQPRDAETLLLCHGMGPRKAERYGEAMLQALARTQGS